MADLQKKFTKELLPTLQRELGRKNLFALPRLGKIVLNMGIKEGLKDAKVLEESASQMALIAGQRPVMTKAKKAIAGFKLRKGDPIGAMLTLRGNRMYDFFERLISVVLPRVRDFHGVKTSSFDGNGNYSLGFADVSVFPEIDTARISRNTGLEITIHTTAKNDEEAKLLLGLLGMPFTKHG